MLTNVLGPGPAAVATGCVPDLDHFRGSFGARGVIPLWRDAAASLPNVDPGWLVRLSDQYGFAVDAPGLMAYCYALLSAGSYTRRFAEELRTPGPRIPLTRDAALFTRARSTGEELLKLHTYRHVVPGRAAWIKPVGDADPTTCGYDAPGEAVWIGQGRVGPVSGESWAFAVSSYGVLRGWLRRRVRRRGKSPLDAIGPAAWTAELSRELLELIWVVETTLARQPELDGLLDQVVAGGSLWRA
jgi:hypothetical protein